MSKSYVKFLIAEADSEAKYEILLPIMVKIAFLGAFDSTIEI
jgi:hypothetical protein